MDRWWAQAYDLDVAKGWERASIDLNTRPVRVQRDIRREDFLPPSNDRAVPLLAACLLCGVMLSVLYVFFPLLLISFAGIDLGAWLIGSVLAVALASAILLFVWELRARRAFADEL
jgi:protein-S-isoprenylcysteine O-methyltransferase Ste14